MSAGKEAMTSFQGRETKLATLKKEKLELACRLYTLSDVVSMKEKYYENLLTKWKEGVDKSVEEADS